MIRNAPVIPIPEIEKAKTLFIKSTSRIAKTEITNPLLTSVLHSDLVSNKMALFRRKVIRLARPIIEELTTSSRNNVPINA